MLKLGSSFPLTNLIGFILVLLIAKQLDWQTKDLVWSLWLSSLLVGILTFLVSATSGLVICIKYLKPRFLDKHVSNGQTLGFLGLGILGFLFFLGFFCFHFCGFHAGHAVFLSMFFPLIDGANPGDFGDNFTNPIGLIKKAFTEVLPQYFWFLIPALVMEAKKIFTPLYFAIKNPSPDFDLQSLKNGKKPDIAIGDPMLGPYKNVIRLHILIFFFAACHILKVDNFLVYAVVYSVYFFPWEIFKRNKETEVNSPS